MTGSATRARAFLGAVGTVAALCVWGSLSTGSPLPGSTLSGSTPTGSSATAPAADLSVRAGTTAAGPVAADVAAAAAGTADAAPSGVHPVVYTTAGPGQAAAVAVDFALRQIGLPYVWGGDGPAAGDAGFDCSGLTHAAYGAAGVVLPRTAQTQYDAGPHLPTGTVLQAGDLVFYGTPSHVHHVGIALDAHRMVNAPTFGEPVQVASIRDAGDDYVGATRPAAGLGAPLVLPAPVAARIATVPVTAGPPPAAAPVAATAAVSPPSPATAAGAVPTGAVPTGAVPTAAVSTAAGPTSTVAAAPAPSPGPTPVAPAPTAPTAAAPTGAVPGAASAGSRTSGTSGTTASGTTSAPAGAATGSGSVPPAGAPASPTALVPTPAVAP